MGINIGQALVKIAADSSGLPGQFGDAERKTKSWASNMAGSVKTIMTGALLGGITIATGAVVGVGKAVIDMASDTQEANANIRAEFGLTAAEASAVSQQARTIWGENWGESITDVAGALAAVNQQLGELGVTSEQEVGDATKAAIGLRDTYGMDVSESLDTARTLMENFGLTSDQAFDFIASGFQRGLNRSDDFVDSINEYSLQFAEGGANAEQFFSMMESGLAGGMLGTDKAADAFKEFRVRILDGSQTTSDALEKLGIDSEVLTQQLADGSMTTIEAWDLVTEALRNTDDEALKIQAGVGLIGTQFEDLGDDIVLGMTSGAVALEDLAGGTDALSEKYTSFGAMFEGFKRKALSALGPIVDKVLEWGQNVMPIVEKALEKLSELLEPVIDAAVEGLEAIMGIFQSFMDNIEDGQGPLDALINALEGLAPDWLIGALETLRDTVVPFVQDLIDRVADFVSFKDVMIALGLAIATVLVPAAISLAVSLAPVLLAVGAIIGLIALVRTAWEENWGGIRDKLTEVWEGTIQPALEVLKEWLEVNIPIAIEALRSWWVDTAWPAIQNAIEVAWPIIETVFNAIKDFVIDKLIPTIKDLYEKWTTEWWPAIQDVLVNVVWPKIEEIFNAIKDFVIDKLIPTIKDLYEKWTTEWWPTIQTVLENVWTVISGIFEEIGRWINDNIVPWIEFLHEKWVETIWPAIQEAVETVWEFLEPIFEAIGKWMDETIPPILDSLGTKFSEIWAAIKDAIQPVKDLWDAFKEAVESFWNWISGKVFNFKIEIPDLPDWAKPDSPLPIHTAWVDFAKDMDRLSINLPGEAGSNVALGQRTTDRSVTNNYYLTYHGGRMEEDLAGDIRALELLRI